MKETTKVILRAINIQLLTKVIWFYDQNCSESIDIGKHFSFTLIEVENLILDINKNLNEQNLKNIWKDLEKFENKPAF